MKLAIDFDDETIQSYCRRGSSPLLFIHFENHEESYPSASWTDFGCVVLAWWMEAVAGLLIGSDREELLFMDGPYSLVVRRIGELVNITTRDQRLFATVTLMELVDTVLAGAEKAAKHLLTLQDSEEYAATVAWYSDMLRKRTGVNHSVGSGKD